jgi:VanZ family protein
MVHRLIAVAAWASLAFIAYATLTRVDFVYAIYFKLSPILEHPAVRSYALFEHFIAFAFFGAALFFAHPRRLVFVCCVVFCSAVVLEVMQTLTPDRHGTLVDALQKLAGGAFGIFISRCTYYILSDRKRRSAATPEF